MGAVVRRQTVDRRRRVLEAARYLVLRQGLRATTMEAIAREARVAKPTLYGYFRDKEAVFAGVVDDLAAQVVSGFDAALGGDGDMVTRVGAALAVKHKVIARVLDSSPHADELFGEHGPRVASKVRAVESYVEAAVSAELAAAGIARPRQLTQVLLAAAGGVARKATVAGEVGPAIRLLTERLLRPELGG
jgi:AcrR family transcriptional regulator